MSFALHFMMDRLLLFLDLLVVIIGPLLGIHLMLLGEMVSKTDLVWSCLDDERCNKI